MMMKEEALPDLEITLVLDDGSETECEALMVFPAGKRQYIALTPKENMEEEIWFYRFVPTSESDFDIENIEDDEEAEIVEEKFLALVEEAEASLVLEEDGTEGETEE